MTKYIRVSTWNLPPYFYAIRDDYDPADIRKQLSITCASDLYYVQVIYVGYAVTSFYVQYASTFDDVSVSVVDERED